jgi:hypothetical protein
MLDKYLHAIISFITVILIVILGLILHVALTSVLFCASIITLFIALGKEFILDKYLGLGKFDKRDMLANVIGITLALILVISFNYYIKG